MRHLRLLALAATAVWLHPDAASERNAHPVTLHLASFTREVVVVHVVQSRRPLQVSGDTTQRFIDTLTVRTPADLRVDSAVKRMQLATEGNLAIRVRFTDGASEKERALAPWGRRLTFVRTGNGDLESEAQVMPAEPTRSR